MENASGSGNAPVENCATSSQSVQRRSSPIHGKRSGWWSL